MWSARVLARTIAWSVQRRGVLATVRQIGHYASVGLIDPESDSRFDAAHGTDTDGIIRPAEMDVRSPNLRFGTRYEATPKVHFCEAMEALPADPQGFTFVDLGCGKGRTLLMASEYPFRQIIGVDYSPNLCCTAATNINIASKLNRRCTRLKVECCDAASYEFPPEPLVIYMFNPFHQQVMRTVLAKLTDSIMEHPRTIYIIYRRPVLRELLNSMGFLDLVYAGESTCIYRSDPLICSPRLEADPKADG